MIKTTEILTIINDALTYKGPYHMKFIKAINALKKIKRILEGEK